jgi:hypothetical protein
MNKVQARDVALLRRIIGPTVGEWKAIGREVWYNGEDGERRMMAIVSCEDRDTAKIVALSHNLFLPLLNDLTMTHRKMADMAGKKDGNDRT